MKKQLFCGAVAALLSVTFSPAHAAGVNDQINSLVAAGNYSSIQGVVDSNPKATDDIVKSLLRLTQENMAKKPDVSAQTIIAAGKLADKISPPSVPTICADMRRVVEGLSAESAGTPLYASVLSTSQSFAKAPVVVAAGRPKLCEEAWIQANNLGGDDAQLAQQPGFALPTLQHVPRLGKPVTPPEVIVPPTNPPDIIKPSAE